MKTDSEIKEFIDSKEALTQKELAEWMYDNKWRSTQRLYKWWDYVLQTKNWDDLKEYRDNKINNGNPKTEERARFKEYLKLYNSDGRISKNGKRYISKLLKEVYNFEIPYVTIGRYNKLIRGNNGFTSV